MLAEIDINANINSEESKLIILWLTLKTAMSIS